MEPSTGESFFLELPNLNSENFGYFLKSFSKVKSESFNVLIMDNGAFHKASGLKIPKNVKLEFLPPYSPELNPIERLWLDLKTQLSKEKVETLDELSDKICAILRNYTSEKLKSLTSYFYFVTSVALIYV